MWKKTATDYLGFDITLWKIRDFLNQLYRRDRVENGILVQLKKQLLNIYDTQIPAEALAEESVAAMKLVQETRDLVNSFFEGLTTQLRKNSADNSNSTNRFRYTNPIQLFAPIQPLYADLTTGMEELRNQLDSLSVRLLQLPEDLFTHQQQLLRELNAQLQQLQALMINLQFLIETDNEDFVYWFELPKNPNSNDSRLYAAPLEVGNLLNDQLFSRLKTAIFTSATLAVANRLDYFIDRIGLNFVVGERLETKILSSPFHYAEQVQVQVPAFFDLPSDGGYHQKFHSLVNRLKHLKKSILALFTSYSTLNEIHRLQSLDVPEIEYTILAQGIHGSRQSLVKRFLEQQPALLLGTDSFWEGVDFPGKALEIVLINRLPFEVPTDPVFQARSDLIKSRGGNAFMDYAVPEAVIRFRQGFGRLIRSRSDYGVVIITDTRVFRKRYGRFFLESLPVAPIIEKDPETFWNQIENWFR